MSERDALINVFALYCKYGDRTGERVQGMTGRNFKKLADDAGLCDAKLTASAVDLAFAKSSRVSGLDSSFRGKRITFQQFQVALQLVADAKGVDVAIVTKALAREPSMISAEPEPEPLADAAVDMTSTGEPTWLPRPSTSFHAKNLLDVYERYSRIAVWSSGETLDTPGLSSRGFAQLVRDHADLGSDVPHGFIDRTFSRVLSGGTSHIGFAEFLSALELVAEQKGIDVEEVHAVVGRSAHPEPPQSAAIAAAAARPAGEKHAGASGSFKLDANQALGPFSSLKRTDTSLSLAFSRKGSSLGAASMSHAILRPPPLLDLVRPFGMVERKARFGGGGGLPSPSSPVNPTALRSLFDEYARFGNSQMTESAGLSSRNFAKLFKDAGMTGKDAYNGVMLAVIDLAYTRASTSSVLTQAEALESMGNRLSFTQFLIALELIAEGRHGQNGRQLHSYLLLKCAGGPVINTSF